MSHYVFSVNELGLGISWTYPSKIGRTDAALEAMLLSMASRYLIAVLVEGTTQDLWYLKSLFYSTALILVVHVHDKHDHNDLFHRHRSDH